MGVSDPTLNSASLIENYKRWEPEVNAWECYHPDRVDENRINVGVKDVINTAQCSTQMGSGFWKGFTPGNDARVVSRLKESGCAILGKTVTAEFAVHHPGPTKNPHNLTRTPGTSSSGSAVAVACGMADAALGTQTGGSIIRPASYCGVYAMKPSFGLIPRTGILKTADTLDTVGFFARNVHFLRLMFEICRVDGPDYPQTRQLNQKREIQKIGILWPECQNSWPLYALEALDYWLLRLEEFFTLHDAPWNLEGCYDVHRRIYHKSLSYYFQKESDSGQVSEIFKSQVEEGRTISPQRYQDDLAIQESLSRVADGLLKDFDILITLSSGGEAPEDELKAPRDTCLVWTMTGVPVINIPALVSPDGLPFGISIVARKYHDTKLLEFLNVLIKNGLAPHGPNPKL